MQSTLSSSQILMKIEFSLRIFEKYSNKFHENPSIGIRLFHAEGQTEMTYLIVASRNFVNRPKKSKLNCRYMYCEILNKYYMTMTGINQIT